MKSFKKFTEATYQGKKVALNKPSAGDVKKSKVFVDPAMITEVNHITAMPILRKKV